MKKLAMVLSLLLLTSGCFEIDQSIELKKDMSGTADFHLGIDLEPMVVVMAQFAKEMEGKSGPLTAEELARAKAEFKKKSESEKEEKPSRAEMEKQLPPGVKLLDFAATEREFGVDTRMKFGFDKLQSLVGIKLPAKEGGDPSQKNVIDTPFEGLELIDKGKSFTIRTRPQNPAESVKEEAAGAGGPKVDPEMEKMMRDAFSKLRVSYRITAPFEIVSHNATRVEGKTLIWEYNLETFEKMSDKQAEDLHVQVTFRK
jgi:hypothetical protein